MSNFNVGFVIFPDLTQLDFTGPLQVLARLPRSTTCIVAKTGTPVPSDCGLSLVPTHTFANCPPLDLIYTDLLPLVGATYRKARIVRDGNVTSAGGVTAGIDFGLSVVAEIAGEATAQAIQLGIEYDPAPPFDSGHPDRTPTAVKSAVAGRYERANRDLRAAIERARS